MRMRPRRLLLSATLFGMTSASVVGPASAQDLSAARRELTDIEATVDQMKKVTLRSERLRSPTHVEERLIDGELFYGLKDYLRAAVIFTDIVEHYPEHVAYPDALFLLGESLFKAGDYLGARARYEAILARAGEERFEPYQQRALGRLLELAIHLEDFSSVDGYFARLSGLSAEQIEPATQYFRAKYLYSRAVPGGLGLGDAPLEVPAEYSGLAEAQSAFEAIPPKSEYYAQARYFLGVIHTLRGEFDAALQIYEALAALEVKGETARELHELAQLAVGRLQYERGDLPAAITAYETIPRTSARFDTALFELTWVFIRMGDGRRAEQSLEVLEIAVPESRYIPDGRLLRGNLLMREGRLDDAEIVFAEVSDTFRPIRDELNEMVVGQTDVGAYFGQLVSENLDTFDAEAFIPASARQWTDPDPEVERAMETLGDLAMVRQLTRETESIVARLDRALAVNNPLNVFTDLRLHRERSEALRNRLTRVRQVAIRLESQVSSPELQAVRAQRRELEQRLTQMPGTYDAIRKQVRKAGDAFADLSKQLNKLEVELMGMDARIVATDHFIHNAFTEPQHEAGVAAYENELATHRQAVATYREAIRALELDLEAGRLQAGVGDQEFARDGQLRDEYSATVTRERQLVQASGRGSSQVDQVLSRVAALELQLDAQDARVHGLATERIEAMRVVLEEERANLATYQERFVEMEDETKEVIGGIAHQGFAKTQQKFYDLVLRADVGTIDVAWARREEHRMRVEQLTRERNSALGVLDREFSEIMDQEGNSP